MRIGREREQDFDIILTDKMREPLPMRVFDAMWGDDFGDGAANARAR